MKRAVLLIGLVMVGCGLGHADWETWGTLSNPDDTLTPGRADWVAGARPDTTGDATTIKVGHAELNALIKKKQARHIRDYADTAYWLDKCDADSAQIIIKCSYGRHADIDFGMTIGFRFFVDSTRVDTIRLYKKYWFCPNGGSK